MHRRLTHRKWQVVEPKEPQAMREKGARCKSWEPCRDLSKSGCGISRFTKYGPESHNYLLGVKAEVDQGL